jgi:hypothetical protein
LDPPLCRAEAGFGTKISASMETIANRVFEKAGFIISIPPLDGADLGLEPWPVIVSGLIALIPLVRPGLRPNQKSCPRRAWRQSLACSGQYTIPHFFAYPACTSIREEIFCHQGRLSFVGPRVIGLRFVFYLEAVS